MKEFELWKIGGPSVLVVDARSTTSLAEVMPPSGSMAVAHLDGSSMVEADDVFGLFSSALKFPVYFGWNWDAFSDCLRDMSWYPSDRYLIVIDNAEKILLGSAEEREILFSILRRAVHEWANPLGKPSSEGIPFKVLLLAADESVEGLRKDVAGSS